MPDGAQLVFAFGLQRQHLRAGLLGQRRVPQSNRIAARHLVLLPQLAGQLVLRFAQAAQAALALGVFPEDELFFVHLVTQPGVQVVELFFKLQVALFNLAPPRVELCQQLAAGPMLGAVGLE